MVLSQKDFQILEALDSHQIKTQRQLAEHAGVSLGQVNYVLKSFLEKGLVKIGKFRKIFIRSMISLDQSPERCR